MQALKERLYFLAARYFRLCAAILLARWRPFTIVVTGSSGKTTLLHMIEAQLGERAHYSHHANSAFGIPFDILGLEGVGASQAHWLKLFLLAPIRAFRKPYPEKLYVAEADAERPGEAPFIAGLLKPHVTLWVSSARTHSRFYDASVRAGRFTNVEAAVAHEYGQMARATRQLVLFDGDNPDVVAAMSGLSGEGITAKDALKTYTLERTHTLFELKNKHLYRLPQPQPREVFRQVAMLDRLLAELKIEPDYDFSQIHLPPGRSSVFDGKNGMTLVDSTYNANLSSMAAILGMFKDFPGAPKWVVLGDMLEQGEGEAEEHRKLAHHIAKIELKQVVLYGERVTEFTAPELVKISPETPIASFTSPKEVLGYLRAKLQGGETILFKGGRMQEGIIEQLLANPEDAAKLVRRDELWSKKRQAAGLPS